MEALRLYTQGGRAFSQGDTSGGFGLLQEAVEIDPEFAAAHAYLGARYRESGQLKLAQEHTARAYEFRDRLKHTTEVPLIEMDYFESVKFDLESAIQAGRKGQQKQTTSPWHNMLLAGLLIEAGRPEEGLDVARIGFQGSDHYLLAHNYLILNRLSEAKADLERRFLEEPEKHKERLYLWIIAFLEGDQELLDREERWIDTKLSDGSVDLVRLHQTFYHGQFRRGRQLLDDLIIFLNQQKRAELGDRLLREQAWVEAIVGNHRRSRDYLALPVDVNDTHLEQVLGSAYTLTLLGEPEQAESLLEDARKLYPDATLLKNLHTPTIGAMIESRRGDPESAHERLRPAALYEKAPQADKYKLISGQILLELKRGDEAVEAFQKIVDNPGQITYFFRRQKPVSSWIELPVAQVGLARAKTISGDVTGARAAYEQFFEMWKDADEDIPLLVEAKAEYNRLTTDN
jgi:tetratricopeptide (TPR) repeat protein